MSAFYYGDTEVNVGAPFSITCRISMTEPIQWLKDDVILKSYDDFHTIDDYIFIESEGINK